MSAPGKVLVAGGYLVMERPNVGVVISSTARFYTTIKFNKCQKITDDSVLFNIDSPQFYSSYTFSYNVKDGKLSQTSGSSNNFIEKCLFLVVSFAKKHYGENFSCIIQKFNGVQIKLRADNDFYSQIMELKNRQLPLLSSSLKTIPQFYPCPKDAEGNVLIAKTGMGSSASLTTSFVGALLQAFNIVDLTSTKNKELDRKIVHNLSQLAHGNTK